MKTEGIRRNNAQWDVEKYYDGFKCEKKIYGNLRCVILRLKVRREKQANYEINLLQIQSDFKIPSLNRACAACDDNIDNVDVLTNTWRAFRSRPIEMKDRYEKSSSINVVFMSFEFARKRDYTWNSLPAFNQRTHLSTFFGNTIRFGQNDTNRREMGVFRIFHPSPRVPSEQ